MLGCLLDVDVWQSVSNQIACMEAACSLLVLCFAVGYRFRRPYARVKGIHVPWSDASEIHSE